MKLVTFEISTRLGNQRRLGAWIEGDLIIDLNSACTLNLSETMGKSESEHTQKHQSQKRLKRQQQKF